MILKTAAGGSTRGGESYLSLEMLTDPKVSAITNIGKRRVRDLMRSSEDSKASA